MRLSKYATSRAETDDTRFLWHFEYFYGTIRKTNDTNNEVNDETLREKLHSSCRE